MYNNYKIYIHVFPINLVFFFLNMQYASRVKDWFRNIYHTNNLFRFFLIIRLFYLFFCFTLATHFFLLFDMHKYHTLFSWTFLYFQFLIHICLLFFSLLFFLLAILVCLVLFISFLLCFVLFLTLLLPFPFPFPYVIIQKEIYLMDVIQTFNMFFLYMLF